MQTFLPYPDFGASVRCLDYRRLGKQRSEALQLLSAIRNGGGWSHHPAARMWRGYEDALTLYMNCAIIEWVRRGFRNNMQIVTLHSGFVLPEWLGRESFHASHRSNLLRKDPVYYGQFGWLEQPGLPYEWPVNLGR